MATVHPANEVHNASTGMDPHLIAQAQEAQEREKALGFRATLRNFGPGIFFSMMLSVALSESPALGTFPTLADSSHGGL